MDTSTASIQPATIADIPLQDPFQMDPDDHSGTPVALIELARRGGRLEFLDEAACEDVLVEFPMGPIPELQTGASRFVRLRAGGYALVR